MDWGKKARSAFPIFTSLWSDLQQHKHLLELTLGSSAATINKNKNLAIRTDLRES